MAPVSDPIARFKTWIYPSLVSILAAIIWHDVNEIKSDVKLLMAQSNIDKTRIDALEKQMDLINGQVFKTSILWTDRQRGVPPHEQAVAYNREAKLEDELDVKKYITFFNFI